MFVIYYNSWDNSPCTAAAKIEAQVLILNKQDTVYLYGGNLLCCTIFQPFCKEFSKHLNNYMYSL